MGPSHATSHEPTATRRAGSHGRRALIAAAVALAMIISGCGQDETATADGAPGDGANPTTAPAPPTTAVDETEPDAGGRTDASGEGDRQPEATTDDERAATSPGGPTALFPGVNEFGIVFDISNSDLHDQFDHERLDITQKSVKLPEPGQAGAFVMAMAEGQANVGGWAEADGSVTTLTVDTTVGSRAGLSAILSVMASTAPSDQASVDAFWAALQEVAGGEVGTARFLPLGDRAVLLERPDGAPDDGVSLVVTGPSEEDELRRIAPAIRAAVTERQQR